MPEVFFCADTHFGHKGILEFNETKTYRHFETIEEHDAELVRRWNSVVMPKDTVWHLGDFAFGKRNIIIAQQLNGIKRLVMGNHDMYGAEEYLKYFRSIYGCCEYKGMIFSHIPVHENQLKRYYINVHGHLHTKRVMRFKQMRKVSDLVSIGEEEIDPRYICVSMEQICLTPIPLDWIYDKWAANN